MVYLGLEKEQESNLFFPMYKNGLITNSNNSYFCISPITCYNIIYYTSVAVYFY